MPVLSGNNHGGRTAALCQPAAVLQVRGQLLPWLCAAPAGSGPPAPRPGPALTLSRPAPQQQQEADGPEPPSRVTCLALSLLSGKCSWWPSVGACHASPPVPLRTEQLPPTRG